MRRLNVAGVRGRAAARGASMIEVLVAVLIVALGILALAGLLSTANRFSKTSEYRSMATMLAADIADRMRANFGGRAAYTWQPATLETDGPAEAAACAAAAGCDNDEMAAQDLAAWRRTVYNSLPQGTGYVLPAEMGNSKLVDIWIIWRDPNAEGTAVIENSATDERSGCPPEFSEDDSPRCMHFVVGL